MTLLRDLGAALSPVQRLPDPAGHRNAAAAHRAQHCANALAVANYLAKRPEVTKVIHPSLQTGVLRERADKYLKGGYGGLVGFELGGGARPGGASSMRWSCSTTSPISAMRAASPSIRRPRRIRSSAPRPAATGVTDGYVRLSIGMEHIDDILADIERGLAAAGNIAKAA